MTIGAQIGNGALTKAGAGVLELTAANTYTGATTVNGGTLQAGAAAGGQAFGNLSAVTLANATGVTLNLNNFSQTIGSLAGGGGTGGEVTLGTATLTTGGDNTNTTFAGVISGTGGLIKVGTGAQTLSGSNTFGGATTVNGGTLVVGEAGTTGALGATSDVIVNSGGTLLLNGDSGTFGSQALNTQVNDSAPVAVNEGGSLSMQGVSYARENLGALTLTGNSIIDFGTLTGNTARFTSLTFGFGFSSLSIYNWTGSLYGVGITADNGTSDQDRLAFTNKPDLGPDNNWAKISFYSDNGLSFLGNAHQISFDGGFELVPVPEPGTILGGLALVGLIGYRERRRLGSLLQRFMKKQVI
jgi:autotransporter-associated beta strand protein